MLLLSWASTKSLAPDGIGVLLIRTVPPCWLDDEVFVVSSRWLLLSVMVESEETAALMSRLYS